MSGYRGRPDATARVMTADGWLRTGDAARMDDDGDVWIVDRIEARFRSDGQLIYPGDVERALMTHPVVVDAGVVGVPADGSNTLGVAFVMLEPGASVTVDELLAHCRDLLPAGVVPASIVFVDSLPRNAVGKLTRSELARLATARASSVGTPRRDAQAPSTDQRVSHGTRYPRGISSDRIRSPRRLQALVRWSLERACPGRVA